MLWKYYFGNSSWVWLGGEYASNVYADFTTPYPGAVYRHAMVMSNDGSSIYLYGGDGYALGKGIFFILLIDKVF